MGTDGNFMGIKKAPKNSEENFEAGEQTENQISLRFLLLSF